MHSLKKAGKAHCVTQTAIGAIEDLERRLLFTTYYVSPSGSDASAGTSDASAFATLQHAADLVGAGDSVLVRAGTYAAGFALGYGGSPRSGTAAAPIRFLADPGVTITGKAPHSSSSYMSGIDLSNGSNYITISGFVLNDAQGNMSGAGIWLTNCAHVSLLNNTCSNTAKWGILTGFCDYLDIEHNTASGLAQHGIYVGNACTSPVVMYNTCFNNGRSGIQLNGDKLENPTTSGIIDHATIEYNVCYNDALTSAAAAISLDGTQQSVIADNLIYDHHGNGIVLFPADGGVLNGGVDPASSNNLIADNTVVNCKFWAVQIIWGSTGNVLLDNILWTDPSSGSYGSIECDAASRSGFASDYNVVVGSNPVNGAFNGDANDGTPLSFAQWKSQSGQDAHSLAVSSGPALFAAYSSPTASSNDYHLKASSPAVDGGAASLAGQNALPLDLDGNPRPQGGGYDIGAYELAQATAPTPPAAPSALAAAAVSASQIDLAWTDNSTNETGFSIERSTDGVNFTQVAAVAANVTKYSDTTVSPGTAYTYRVRATNSAGDSPYSNTATASTPASAPAAPSSLSATAVSSSSIDLSWTRNSTNETGFDVERSVDGVNFTQVATTAAGATSYADTGLDAGTQYTYRVRAFNVAGSSTYSNTATAQTATSEPTVPAAPSNLSATTVSSTEIDLTWTTNSTNETGFKVQRMAPGGTFIQVAVVGAGVTHYADTGLAAGTQYTYEVSATNSAGDSAESNTATATTLAAPASLAAPSKLAASAVNMNRMKLTWVDNSNSETGFSIERATGKGAFIQIATTGANVSSYTDRSVVGGTVYSYRVRAISSTGDSAYSNISMATTPWSLWSASAGPSTSTATSSDTQSVELGVQFRSDVSGYITAIRFYKGSGNGGTHVAHLWTAGGVLLASATFTAETSSGWQQVNLPSPVAISANTIYVASYFAPAGGYADNHNYFTSSGVTSGPLHGLGGVYHYGSTGGFPTDSWLSSNYWVDVLFTT